MVKKEASMKLRDALKKKKFVVTSEVQAPIDQEPQELVHTLTQVRGRIDGVSLSEVEFEGIVSDTIRVCQILTQNQLEPIYQTTTRDKNRLQLQKDLIRTPMRPELTICWCLPKITASPATACRK
jgi:methylenetetrahydrofolate reductase (NADPH)